MAIVSSTAAAVASLIHVGFFLLESVWFTRPKIYRRFFVTSERDSRVLRVMAFNQGFYNLFLAFGAAAGISIVAAGGHTTGRALIIFSCGCMAAAGLVLFGSDHRFLPASLIQALPAIVAVAAAATAA